MKRYLLTPFLAALALAGCAATTPAPVTPTPAEIAAESAALQATALAPLAYFEAGVALNFQNCHAWFDSLASRANEYSTASGLTAIGGGGASAFLAASGAGVPAVAAAGVATGIVSGTLNALSSSTGIPYPVETGGLVEQAQNTFLGTVAAPQTLPEAQVDIDRMAELCGQRGAEALAAQAVGSAQTMVVGSGASSAAFATSRPAAAFPTPPQVIVR